MDLWLLLIFLIYAPYFLLIVGLGLNWQFVNKTAASYHGTTPQKLSIIIPFRNEDGVIDRLIAELITQLENLENIDVYLINDHSSDNSYSSSEKLIVGNSKFSLMNSYEKGKKAALTTGIEQTDSEWIITLDADVRLPKKWAQTISNVCSSSSQDLIILPVQVHQGNQLFQQLESLDFLAMQGFTFGFAAKKKAFLANGAHLTFRKTAFNMARGYTSHSQFASGDDVLLLHSFRTTENLQVGYAFDNDLMVKTKSSDTLKELFNQRIRWGAKSVRYKLPEAIFTSILIFLSNIVLIPLAVTGQWNYLLGALLFKSIADIAFLFPILRSYKSTALSKYLLLFIVIYPFYITFVSVASLFVKPTWKGRRVQ